LEIFDENSDPIIPSSDSTLGVGLESIEYMTKAALYARVSTDKQREEATIESQLFELKRQIATAGHTLVKEYIDDGHSGAYLDRPALDELRAALKTDTFDVVYFLCADRIAREPIHQRIIVSELLKHKKRIIISGKDYEENPENKFALTVLGAVAEFERAKITERMMRGKKHRLRMGQLPSQGGMVYCYTYIKKTDTSPPALAVNEEQAAVVRSIFEMYASGGFSTAAISRALENRGVPTYKGGRLWDHGRIVKILKNHTYTGTRYFNTMTVVRDDSADGTHATRKRYRLEYRDRDEWIAVNVPAIVSRELFDKVQERLRVVASRYRALPIQSFLTGFVRCASCGRLYGSGYSYEKFPLRTGGISTRHRGQYRCSKRFEDRMHDVGNKGRCRNLCIATTILDNTVVGLIRRVMLDPGKLARCIEGGHCTDGRAAIDELARIAEAIDELTEKRGRIFEAYAKEQMRAEDYIEAGRAIDEGIVRLRREKEALFSASRETGQAGVVAASVRQFCATARARFEACADLEAKRAFLRDHVERIVFDHGKVTILGSLPLQGAVPGSLPFRIEGEIEKGSRRRWPQDERFGSWVPAVCLEAVSACKSI
jgi:site-specific DNA recombinase